MKTTIQIIFHRLFFVMKGITFKIGCDTFEESVYAASLCFQRYDLETLYQAYQFEIASKSLLGKFGVLSMTTVITLVNMLEFFCKYTVLHFKKYSPGSFERMVIAIPMTIYCLQHQFRIQTRNEEWIRVENARTSFHSTWRCSLFLILYSCLSTICILSTKGVLLIDFAVHTPSVHHNLALEVLQFLR